MGLKLLRFISIYNKITNVLTCKLSVNHLCFKVVNKRLPMLSSPPSAPLELSPVSLVTLSQSVCFC